MRDGMWLKSENSLTFKATFEPEVSVWLTGLSRPVHPAILYHQGSLPQGILFSYQKAEGRYRYEEVLCFSLLCQHSLHTNTDNPSAHLSWTLNHFPGVYRNNSSMLYHTCFWVICELRYSFYIFIMLFKKHRRIYNCVCMWPINHHTFTIWLFP